jgi:hypothetical protein
MTVITLTVTNLKGEPRDFDVDVSALYGIGLSEGRYLRVVCEFDKKGEPVNVRLVKVND